MIGPQIDIVPTEIHILVKGRSGDMPIDAHKYALPPRMREFPRVCNPVNAAFSIQGNGSTTLFSLYPLKRVLFLLFSGLRSDQEHESSTPITFHRSPSTFFLPRCSPLPASNVITRQLCSRPCAESEDWPQFFFGRRCPVSQDR